MPSSISCCRRSSPPPPYSRSVMLRRESSLSCTSESSSSSGTRPTCAFQTWALSVRPPGRSRVDDAGGAVGLAQQGQRQAVGVEDRVVLLLPAVEVERLLEVAGLVEEADADDGHAEVGGGLEVVTGQDAEAAGVLRQHLGDAVLGAEVGDRGGRTALDVRGPLLVPPRLGEVGLQVRRRRVDPRDEHLVGGQAGQLVGGQRRQQGDGVLADLGPALGIDLGEKVAGRRVPRPPQVAGEVSQRGDGFGQDGADAEATDGLHGTEA